MFIVLFKINNVDIVKLYTRRTHVGPSCTTHSNVCMYCVILHKFMLNIIKYLGGGSKVPKVYAHNKNILKLMSSSEYLLILLEEKLVDNLEGPKGLLGP